MVDILYLAHGREEFAAASLHSLLENTQAIAAGEARMCIYTDGPIPGVNITGGANTDKLGGPVPIMNHFIASGGSDIFAKIDNDVIVTPGWLESALAVMQAHPELDILGLEPPHSRTPNPQGVKRKHEPLNEPEFNQSFLECCYARASSVGGVFVARRKAFEVREPIPASANGRGGFTSWQERHAAPDAVAENRTLVVGWIVPPLKLFLLDRLPFEPWLSLSKRYIAEGIQRPWTNYDPAHALYLWEWWKP